jgi:ferric-dicitrate binding protein FerR (iron transport regulator)
MNCNIFDTEQEAIDAQEADFQEWKASKPQNPEAYWEVTTKYAEVKQRITDNKWYYVACPASTSQHTVEPYNVSWSPANEATLA